MALVTETTRKCDVYPGARDVRRTRVTVEYLNEDGVVVETLPAIQKDLSKRARNRLLGFLDRGSLPPNETNEAPDKKDGDADPHPTT